MDAAARAHPPRLPPELVERHDPLIVSAGFHETIEPILEREGVRARSSPTT